MDFRVVKRKKSVFYRVCTVSSSRRSVRHNLCFKPSCSTSSLSSNIELCLEPTNHKVQCFSFCVCVCRGILPMSSRSVLNHSQQVGGPTSQAGGIGGGERGGSGAGRSGSMGSPSRSSPSIIGMPKQQQARQPFTINRYHTHAFLLEPGLVYINIITIMNESSVN